MQTAKEKAATQAMTPAYLTARARLCGLVWSDDHGFDCEWRYHHREDPCSCDVGKEVDRALADLLAGRD